MNPMGSFCGLPWGWDLGTELEFTFWLPVNSTLPLGPWAQTLRGAF